MIRQNRAVPILLVLTLAWLLYLAGCFGSDESSIATDEGIETPTTVPTATAVPIVGEAANDAPPAEDEFVHTIEQGDLLASIAAKYSVSPDVISRANPGLDPNVLIVGQRLRIPGATTDNSALDNPDPADRAPREIVTYFVQEGDSLGAIADEYIVSVQAILELNPAVNPQSLQIGQTLTIPPIGTGLDPEEVAALRPSTRVERVPGETLTHTVQAGDLLEVLADLYQVTVDEIIAANLLDDANQIRIGDELLIPPPNADG